MALLDIKAAEEQAKKEVAEEAIAAAKVARATARYYDEKESGLLVPKVAAKIITLGEYRKSA